MTKLGVRFIKGMGTPTENYRGGERDGDRTEFDAVKAIRLVQAEICIPLDQKKYDAAVKKFEELEQEEADKKELAEMVLNLNNYKVELEGKELEVEDLKAKISKAEKALK